MPVDLTRRSLYIDRVNKLGITLQEISLCLQDYRVDTKGMADMSIFMDENTKVNGFSLNKPFRWAKWGYSIDAAGDAEKAAAREAVKQGLRPVAVTKILEATIGRETFVKTTLEESLAEVMRWEYLPPRGGAYNEPFRIPDFDGYEHNAVPPDSGWSQKDVDDTLLNRMESVTLNVSDTGDYAGYNFKMQPKYNGSDYNGGLYTGFSMLLGPASGESIGTITNMEIPISKVVSLDGYYRIALAVWIPNFGDSGGWGLFASRMTVAQYFKENLGSGTVLQNLFPDLATNPFVASLMADYVAANNGYATFYAVPLFVKNVGYTYQTNNLFCLRSVGGVTEAYCMMSGMRDVPFICGTPPMTIYYKVRYDSTATSIAGFIENTDEENSHTFGYTYTVIIQGVAQTPQTGFVTLAPLEKRQIAGAPSGGGNGLNIVVTSQDGETIN